MTTDVLQPRLVPWREPPEMDPGAPQPAVHADTNRLHCAYYVVKPANPLHAVALLRFEVVLEFRLGYPNDEALHRHALAKFGLQCYSSYLVENSPRIREIEEQNRVHPRFRPGMYSNFRHWIVTFHDEMLEVIAIRALVQATAGVRPDRAVCDP